MQYRCDVGDQEAVTGNRRWAVDTLSWRDAGIGYPTADFATAQRYVARMASRYCGLSLSIVNGSANLVSRFRRIDGVRGVLARHELPGMPSGPHEQLSGEWDSAERPDQAILNVVTAHEICHGLGLIHFNSRPSLMNATLDPQWHDEWDDWTIDELRSRHGKPKEIVPTNGCTWLCETCDELWR